MSKLGLDVEKANDFISTRIDEVKNCLSDLLRVCSYGHFQFTDHIAAAREMLASIGEVHSAYNSTEIIKVHKIPCKFVDLSGWKTNESLELYDKIKRSFEGLDFSKGLVVATGYAKCRGGLMKNFDRGYSEMTFSAIAVCTGANEGVIHKEFHLSSADPNLLGSSKVKV